MDKKRNGEIVVFVSRIVFNFNNGKNVSLHTSRYVELGAVI